MNTLTPPDYGLLIHGEWRRGGGRITRLVINPATGEVVNQLPLATETDILDAADSSARAFASWSQVPALERGRLLVALAGLIRRDEDALARVLTLEQGKLLAEALQEVRNCADTCEWMAEEGKRAYGRIVPARVPDVDQFVRLAPVGPVAAFAPWNFPAVLSMRKVATALAAGCTVVLKPAEECPGVLVALAQLGLEAGLPPGVWNLVFGDPAQVSSRLINHPGIRKISFTGSVPVGRQLAQLAAAQLKRITLELGGHAPVLVCRDVDVPKVVALTLAAKFRNAGQLCLCPTRFFVHESVHDAFVQQLAKGARAFKLGSGLDASTQMGPLASARRVQAMQGFCEDAASRGARFAAGGAAPVGPGYFFPPTVVTDVPDDAKAMQQEPFGPLALVTRFSNLEDAIRRANATDYGLAAYAFTPSLREAHALEHGLQAGNVSLNTYAVSAPEMPFGGVKHSGLGSEMGSEGLREHLEVKAVVRALM